MLEPQGWPEDATYDALIGDWSIYQREKGHKTSTDDVLTAWLAWQMMDGRPPKRYLDLGCGIGSVLLMSSHALAPEYGLGIEAQKQSADMAKASISRLPTSKSIEVLNADFRSAISEEMAHSFDLVTGSPPYFPVGTGTMSQDYQRAACRFELRGGVEAYCEAGARALSSEGIFVLVFQTEWDERVMKAAQSAKLTLRQRVDVQMHTDRTEPFLSVYAFGFRGTDGANMRFAIRDEEGRITPEYRSARTKLGLPTST